MWVDQLCLPPFLSQNAPLRSPHICKLRRPSSGHADPAPSRREGHSRRAACDSFPAKLTTPRLPSMMGDVSSMRDGFNLLRQAPMKPEEADDAEADSLHPGVSCDACSTKIGRKLRYKCFTCPNYDLCQQCRKYAVGDHGPAGAYLRPIIARGRVLGQLGHTHHTGSQLRRRAAFLFLASVCCDVPALALSLR